MCLRTVRSALFLAVIASTVASTLWAQQGESEENAAPETAFSIHLPSELGAKPASVLDRIVLDVTLEMGYAKQPAKEKGRKLAGAPGVQMARLLKKTGKNEPSRLMEIAVAGYPETGYELRGLGWIPQENEQPALPNPDLEQLRLAVERVLKSIPLRAATSLTTAGLNRGYLVYNVSYGQVDRIIAILKALGVSTIEFLESPGDGLYDRVFQPVPSPEQQLPIVVKLIDAPKTSLMDPAAGALASTIGQENVTDLGGTFLHQVTSGEQNQRLLIAYDEAHPEQAQKVLDLLREKLDRPARQIVIEALVLEINTDKARDLGLTFKGGKDRVSGGLEPDQNGSILPFTLTFDRNHVPIVSFQATIKALVDNGEAEVLSKPSVLVLDGRQARIQVGQQVPITKSTSTATATTESVEYLSVGIVLNLRPRVSDDSAEITMQVETIVSAVNQQSQSTFITGEKVLVAPTLDNRQVQTFVRVADNTPFIIGGLISTNHQERRTGIPFLSSLPWIGSLFGRTKTENEKKEVIVVVTPHVVPLDDSSFSYVIPKDSASFDSFGNQLFRNAYRIKSKDVYDLHFVTENQGLRELAEKTKNAVAARPSLRGIPEIGAIVRGEVPGEEILVRRMLWELIRGKEFARFVNLDRTIFFEDDPASGDSSGIQVAFFGPKLAARTREKNALVLTFSPGERGTADHPFPRPKPAVSYESIPAADLDARIRTANAPGPGGERERATIVLSEDYIGSTPPAELLRGVLVLKRLLELNSSLPLTIRDFHAGRQVIFPSEEDLSQRFHVIDLDTAKLFYEVSDYYAAFEKEFNRRTRKVRELIETKETTTAPPAKPAAAR